MQSDLGRARTRHLCLPMSLGQLVLHGVLEHLLQACGDKATQEALEQRDIASSIDLLASPHSSTPHPAPVALNPVAIGRPYNAQDEPHTAAADFVDRLCQVAARHLQDPAVLARQHAQGHGRSFEASLVY